MFDIEAKDVDVTIRNFRIPFFKPGNVTVSIWSKEGSFWYEKNNPAAWTLLGSPLAYSPGESQWFLNAHSLSTKGG